jgi:hypothetical protein
VAAHMPEPPPDNRLDEVLARTHAGTGSSTGCSAGAGAGTGSSSGAISISCSVSGAPMSTGASVELSEFRGKSYRAKRTAYLPRFAAPRELPPGLEASCRSRMGYVDFSDWKDLGDLAASLMGTQPTRE